MLSEVQAHEIINNEKHMFLVLLHVVESHLEATLSTVLII